MGQLFCSDFKTDEGSNASCFVHYGTGTSLKFVGQIRAPSANELVREAEKLKTCKTYDELKDAFTHDGFLFAWPDIPCESPGNKEDPMQQQEETPKPVNLGPHLPGMEPYDEPDPDEDAESGS